jgi:hypothetical protein
LIGHYVVGEAEKVYKWYHPALRFDGSTMTLGESQDGSECGVWVERDGTRTVEMIGSPKRWVSRNKNLLRYLESRLPDDMPVAVRM